MSTESELRRYRDQVVQLRVQLSKLSATVADKRKKAAAARAAAAKTKSAATQRTKQREADTAEKAANDAEAKRSGLEKKIADLEKKVAASQTKYEKQQQSSQAKALEQLRKQNESAARQFTPRRRLGDPAPEPFTPARRLGERAVEVAASALDTYDVFLSHASEDKDEIARPLMEALQALGVTVWFDELKIKVGQSIRQEIERGISHARYGVVVLSPSFFAKQWTQAELDALFSKKMTTGENMLLPVWHRVTKDQVQAQSSLLAGVLALNTSLMTVEEIAAALAEVVST